MLCCAILVERWKYNLGRGLPSSTCAWMAAHFPFSTMIRCQGRSILANNALLVSQVSRKSLTILVPTYLFSMSDWDLKSLAENILIDENQQTIEKEQYSNIPHEILKHHSLESHRVRGYWVSTVCKPKWHICIFVFCNLLLRARTSFVSAAVKSRVLLVHRTIDNLAPMMTSSLPLAGAWKGLSPCKIICQKFKSCKWSLSVSWDHGKLVSHGQHHLAHEKRWNVMEHFRNERARHMMCKRSHALDRGRLNFSAPITSSLIHQLVMCLTSAGKCRTLCQMCALMLESELHELNCLSVQKNSSNRDVASSSVPTQTIFCILQSLTGMF